MSSRVREGERLHANKASKPLFDISCPLVPYLLIGVASCLLNLVMEQRYAVLVLLVLLLMDGRVSKASRH